FLRNTLQRPRHIRRDQAIARHRIDHAHDPLLKFTLFMKGQACPKLAKAGLPRQGSRKAQRLGSLQTECRRESRALGIIVGLVITLGCMLGGFIAMGGHVSVLIQPWEFVIILGAALGTFFIANPFSLVKDTGRACIEAFSNAVPKQRDYLDVLGVLYSLMRELRAKSRNEVEVHIDNPKESPIFQAYPS